MKKTLSVTLGGRAYLIEENAYHILDTYLTRLKQHFVHDPSAGELMDDIEASMAEKFAEQLERQKQDVVTELDVQEVIAVMGQVEEIEQEQSSTAPQGTEDTKDEAVSKRLYRNEDDMVIAGVCSGLAAYLGIEPVFIRALFVLLFFANGVGLLTYLILWVAVPRAETSIQKLEMRGKSANLSEIEELVKQKAQLVTQEGRAAVGRFTQGHASFFHKLLNIPVIIVGAVWGFILRVAHLVGPIVRVLISLPFIVGSALAMVATFIASSTLLFQLYSPVLMTDLPLQEFARSPWYYAGIIGLTVAILIPLMIAMMIGIRFLTRKNHLRTATVFTLAGIWMIAATTIGVTAIRLGPEIQARIQQVEQEQMVTRRYEPAAFHNIVLTGNERITIRPGDAYAIKLTGMKTSLESMEVTSEADRLTLRKTDQARGFCLFCLHKPIEGEITLPALNTLTIGGTSRGTLQGFTNDVSLHIQDAGLLTAQLLGQHVTATVQDVARLNLSGQALSLMIQTEGAARVNADPLRVERLELKQTDVSAISLEGTAERLRAVVTDAARLDADAFMVGHAELTATDTSRAHVHATESLIATTRDNGRIDYQETMASTTLKSFGNSRIRSDLSEE
jgi:phage shock protein PspC (stress-responsive transcriptional regulator)